jgi:hypothetical protein
MIKTKMMAQKIDVIEVKNMVVVMMGIGKLLLDQLRTIRTVVIV